MNSIDKIKKKALEEHIPIIMDDTLEVVGKILEDNRPNKMLEIGTAVGYSAIRFSRYLNDNGFIDTVERDKERVKEATQNIKDLNLEEKIHIYEGDALEILPTLIGPYDVVFIDAAKGKYPIFLSEALRMLNNNGIIIADNVLYKGYVMSDYNKHKQRTAVNKLRAFIDMVLENENLESKLIDIGDGITVSKKMR